VPPYKCLVADCKSAASSLRPHFGARNCMHLSPANWITNPKNTHDPLARKPSR
jgi:hypothetical protein